MPRRRFTLKPVHIRTGYPFESAEMAWLWAARAVRYAEEGAHLTANRAAIARPCEPRDIISLMCKMRKANELSGAESGVLCQYGALDRPPDPRDPEETRKSEDWDRALQKLSVRLIAKGIVFEERHPDAEFLSRDQAQKYSGSKFKGT